MKKFITLLVLMIAFTTNAVAQWNQDSKIKEYHWFGQYEYLDMHPAYLNPKSINWSGNYLESIEIVKTNTGQDPQQRPKTSFYSWLEHQLRFSVDNTNDWTIDGVENSAYYTVVNNDKAYGQGLKNNTYETKKFYIHNLKPGDHYYIRYYENNESQATEREGDATGTVDINIPAGAVIRNVVITLAEYQASDFDVEEVKGSDATSLTSSHDTFLEGEGVDADDPLRTFGTLGYRYYFTHAGVLEDKRGAAPYITMKFGNDNDMTFVRALNEVTYTWGSYKSVTPKLYTKNGDEGGTVSESTPDGNGEYVVHSIDNPGAEWDTQFWIGTTEYSLPAGQKFKIKFDYRADAAATVHTQTHNGSAGPYIWYECLGDALNFTTDWQTFEEEVEIDNNMAGWMSVAFNLNVLTSATNYYFRNITLQIPERTENISTDALGAASTIHESNPLNPQATGHPLQYRWTYKENNYTNLFTETEIKDRFVGKEWSTFTAEEDANKRVNPSDQYDWNTYGADNMYVYGDRFNSIWPLCGNFFYFFPEVDGLLEIDYYCEGSNETNAFWYKQKQNDDGTISYPTADEQPKVQYINGNGETIYRQDWDWDTNSWKTVPNNRTDGTNNYKMMVQVEKGGMYYLCSLPTNISHERPIFRLKSYTFIPIFRVEPLYKWVHNTEVNTSATEKVAKIIGGPYTDLNGGLPGGYGNNTYDLTGTFTRNAESETRVKCLGNVASAKAKVEYDGTDQWLTFYDITFKEGTNPKTGDAYNPGGAVVAHVNNGEGQASFVLTIAYDAADAKWNDDKDTRVAATSGGTGKEVKRWDFYSGNGDGTDGGWDLGKYGEDDGTRYATAQSTWLSKSKLFKETHKADGLTADWEYDWIDVPNKKEPTFKSIYDMEADNADMIHETAGLVFFTDPNELCLYNENDASTATSYQDRYIGLIGGGKLIIPCLKANDRIVIKMGCFGNTDSTIDTQQATLKITGAYDATGTKEIKEENGDYVIGGSGVENGNDTNGGTDITDKSQPWGEYHFVAKGGDFTLEVDKEKNEADLLKFYSIIIYRNAKDNNADILTENELLGDEGKRQILNTQDFTTDADNVELHTHYRGLNEKTNYAKKTPKTGNLTESDLVMTSMSSNTLWHTVFANLGDTPFTPDKAKFGVFKARIGVQTIGEDYVTDYADCMIPVGYRETKKYPYTWDFTDLKKYVSASIDTDGNETQVTEDDLKIWDEYGLRVAPEEWDGNIYASGGQLYGGKTMIAETRGIGITYENNDQVTSMTGDGTDLSGGLAVGNGTYGFIVPQLAKEQAVYVRAHKVNNTTQKHNYEESDGSTTYIYGQSQNSGNVKSFSYHETAADDSGDEIFALVMPTSLGNKKHDVRLNFQGYEVKKIAVSTDPKTVNKLGWATESRDHVTDPELLSYFTGKEFRTYIVTGADHATKTVTLEEVNPATDVMDKVGDAKNQAYIIRNMNLDTDATNTEPGRVEILKIGEKNNKDVKGFHLFVPDMHDYVANSTTNIKTLNPMADSKMKAQLDAGTVTQKGEGTNVYNYVLTTEVATIGSNGQNISGTDQSLNYVGFFRVQKNGVTSSGNQGYLPVTVSGDLPAKYSFVFVKDWDIEVPTAIETPETIEFVEGDTPEYYNLNGQKLNGKPSKSGIYIVNGKKVVLK